MTTKDSYDISLFANLRIGLLSTQLTKGREKCCIKIFLLFQSFIRGGLRVFIVIVIKIFDLF